VDVAGLDTFFLIYGDSYLSVSLADVATEFGRSGRSALMTVLRNRGQWDSSNAYFAEGLVKRYGKGPRSDPSMDYIDYGLLVFEASAITQRLESGATADLADLCADLSETGDLAGYEVFERFYEVGSPQGLADFEAFVARERMTNAFP
jgi:NDP-sugar pyrophosphorylase family protein